MWVHACSCGRTLRTPSRRESRWYWESLAGSTTQEWQRAGTSPLWCTARCRPGIRSTPTLLVSTMPRFDCIHTYVFGVWYTVRLLCCLTSPSGSPPHHHQAHGLAHPYGWLAGTFLSKPSFFSARVMATRLGLGHQLRICYSGRRVPLPGSAPYAGKALGGFYTANIIQVPSSVSKSTRSPSLLGTELSTLRAQACQAI